MEIRIVGTVCAAVMGRMLTQMVGPDTLHHVELVKELVVMPGVTRMHRFTCQNARPFRPLARTTRNLCNLLGHDGKEWKIHN